MLYKVHNNIVIYCHGDSVQLIPHDTESPDMIYTVKPAIVEGCNCEDCRAGRHIYLLYRLPANGSDWSAMGMQTYSSAEECKREHQWGLDFGPSDTWEDGAPIVVPERKHEAHPEEKGMVLLDAKAFAKSAAALEKHWPRDGDHRPAPFDHTT